jgi:hypothetical protein
LQIGCAGREGTLRSQLDHGRRPLKPSRSKSRTGLGQFPGLHKRSTDLCQEAFLSRWSTYGSSSTSGLHRDATAAHNATASLLQACPFLPASASGFRDAGPAFAVNHSLFCICSQLLPTVGPPLRYSAAAIRLQPFPRQTGRAFTRIDRARCRNIRTTADITKAVISFTSLQFWPQAYIEQRMKLGHPRPLCARSKGPAGDWRETSGARSRSAARPRTSASEANLSVHPAVQAI